MAVLADRAEVGLEGRLLGLELRDTLLVLRPGPTAGFVFLFRQPLTESTVAAQMIATGTGGLNIGGCRVETADEVITLSGEQAPVTEAHDGYKRPGRSMFTHKPKERSGPANEDGRWPPNVLLVHAPGCRRVGTRRVHSGTAHRTRSGGKSFGGDRYKPPLPDMTYAEEDGLETATAYECEVGCPVLLLEVPFVDAGGASRFYPQFGSERELLDWLHRLTGSGRILRDG